MIPLNFTPLEALPEIRSTLKATFASGRTRSLSWRRNQLYQTARMLQDNTDAFVQALQNDFGKPRQETCSAEIGPSIEACLISAKELEEWAKPIYPQVPEWQRAWKPVVNKVPQGVVLIIIPWNYPIILAFINLIGAIAAGCCAAIKPSELVPHFSQLLAELLPRYLDPKAYCVVNGSVEEATELLRMQWDHVSYTGSGRVGKIVSTAVAKYLTPTTLELGGKCAVIVDPTYDINLAAKRILWGKMSNAGQICVGPDYVLIPQHAQDALIDALKWHYKEFYPSPGGALASESYARIVTPNHLARLRGLLEQTKGEVVFGGGHDEGKVQMDLAVVKGVLDDDILLEEPTPLAVYSFTEDAAVKQQMSEQCIAANLVFNDVFMQAAVKQIPFGALGESGHGLQSLKYSYDNFTHQRSSIDMPMQVEPFLAGRYPPYNEENLKMLAPGLTMKIPDLE